MILLMFRAGWFLSVMAVLAALLYVYASLPEEVLIQQQGANYLSLSREGLFYMVLGLVTIINVLVFVVASIGRSDELFRSWFHGLIFTLNLFLIITLFLINAVNGTEKFNYDSIGFLIYGSIALIMIWMVAWPIYSFYRKNFPKPSV